MTNEASPAIRSITYDTHVSTISQDKLDDYKDGESLDVSLTGGIDKLQTNAHGCILCQASEVLRTKLNDSTDIHLENVEGASLQLIVDSLYTGSIQLNIKSVGGIVSAAVVLQMDSLAQVCRDFIDKHLHYGNCWGIALNAEHRGYTDLHKLAKNFALENFSNVYTEKEFLQQTEAQLNQFLHSGEASKISQKLLFHSLLAWIDSDPGRDSLTLSLLQFVDYKLLDRYFLLRNRKCVWRSPECTELLDSWLKWHTKPEETLFCIQRISKGQLMQLMAYNPSLNVWSDERIVPVETHNFGICVINEKLIVAGAGPASAPQDTIECIDLKTLRRTELPPMTAKRTFPQLIELNGNLYSLGGQVHTMEMFDFAPCARRWEKRMKLQKTDQWKANIKCAALNGLIYAHYGSVLVSYDPVSNDWTDRTPNPFLEEKTMHIVAVGGFLYAVGRETVIRYDPSKDSWSFVKPFRQMTSIVSCTAFNNRLIVCGELLSRPYVVLCVGEYDPECDEWISLPLLKRVECPDFCLFSA